MEHPPGYVQDNSSLVCLLKKSLYGLKQAPRAWYAKMDSFLLDAGFSICHSNPNVYTKKVGNHIIILVLYVDDLILTGSDHNILTHVKSNPKKKFTCNNLLDMYLMNLSLSIALINIYMALSKFLNPHDMKNG